MYNTNLKKLDSVSDLGVRFDCKLSFLEHINEKINKAYSILGIIKINFIYMDKDTFWPTVRSGLCHRKSVRLSVCNVGGLWPNGLSDRDDFWHTPCPGQQ